LHKPKKTKAFLFLKHFQQGNPTNQREARMDPSIEQYTEDAITQVSAWELPESEFHEAVNAQVRLMIGLTISDTQHNNHPSQ
jgi:hypothetical protein